MIAKEIIINKGDSVQEAIRKANTNKPNGKHYPIKQPKLRGRPKAGLTPKADLLIKTPGTLTYFYAGPIEHYLWIVQIFLDAPLDEDLISAEQKEAFSKLWSSLPDNQSQAITLGGEPELNKKSKAILDLMCDELKINKTRFYQYVEGHVFQFLQDKSEHVRKTRTLELYEKSIEYGLQKDGFKDRNAILQQEGFHYASKPPSININNTNNTLNIAKGLPVFEDTVHALNDILLDEEDIEDDNEPLQLEAAKEVIIINEKEEELVNG